MKNLLSVILLVLGVSLLSLAWATPDGGLDAGRADAGIVDRADSDPVGVGLGVIQDAKRGNWKLAVAGILSLLMFALKQLREHTKVFAGQRGGAILVMLLGLGGWFATTLAAGVDLSWSVVLAGIGIVWTAVGGFHWVRDLFAKKAPAA